MPSEFQVWVLEGTHDSDVATYYAHEEPEIISKRTENTREGQTFVSFVPRNGPVNRVGRINLVPLGRVICIVTQEEIET
jgi:hypothetical protein